MVFQHTHLFSDVQKICFLLDCNLSKIQSKLLEYLIMPILSCQKRMDLLLSNSKQSWGANQSHPSNIVLFKNFFKIPQRTTLSCRPRFLPSKYICYYSGQGYKTGHPTKHNKTSSYSSVQGYYAFRVRYKQYFKIVGWFEGFIAT